MPTATYSFFFDIESNPTCWNGNLSYFELKLLQVLPDYALEQLRVRFLHTLTTTKDPKKSARVLAQMAFETEIGTAIAKSVELPPDARTSVVCERRRYIDVDVDMQRFSFLFAPALEAAQVAALPETYVRLFQTHLSSRYAKYRMSAIAALLCVTAETLIADQLGSFSYTFNDTVSANDGALAAPGLQFLKNDTVSISEGNNVIPSFQPAELVSVSDGILRESAHFEGDAPSVSDSFSLELTQLAYWQDQARPVGVVVDPDFRTPVQVHGVNDSLIYICGGQAPDGQVWRWDGATWSDLGGWPATSGERIWANHDGSKVYAYADDGPYLSTNQGVSWTKLNWPAVFTGEGFHAYEDGLGNVTLYASFNQGGVAMSSNDGTSWTNLLGLSVVGGAFISCIYVVDRNNVYFAGDYTGGALLWHYDGTNVTQITNITSVMGLGGRIYSMWASGPDNIYVGGYRTAGDAGILLRTQDMFATPPTAETLPSFGGLTKNYVNAISGVSPSEIYAAVNVNSKPQVMKYNGVSWVDDAAVQNNLEDAVALWVNPVTKRGVLVTHKGKIQVNKGVAAGQATSFSFYDTPGTADAKTVT